MPAESQGLELGLGHVEEGVDGHLGAGEHLEGHAVGGQEGPQRLDAREEFVQRRGEAHRAVRGRGDHADAVGDERTGELDGLRLGAGAIVQAGEEVAVQIDAHTHRIGSERWFFRAAVATARLAPRTRAAAPVRLTAIRALMSPLP